VHVSVDGGTTFTRVFNHEGALSDRTEATYFMRQWLEVPSAAGMSAVVFRFRAAGGDPDQWEGFWVLDNVKVTANKAAPGGGLTAVNIGDAGGSTQDKGNGAYTLVGGGAVAFNADGDTLHFAYESITGDFDKKVKIKSLTGGASTRNRGGIMVRESVDPLSESLKLTASGLSSEPDQNGNPQGANNVELWVRSDTTANVSKIGRSYGNLTQNLPNQWLRLKRVGPYFASYVSTDGQNWSLIVDRYAPALGNAVLVGLYAASASEDLSSKATVEYEGYGNVTGTDNLPPTLVSAGTLDKKIVGVKFSELLNSSTVVAGNFQVSGATVGSASVGIGGDSVYLGVTGLAADTFTVTVSGVKDAAGNLIAANSQVGGKAVTGWTAVDVGSFATGPGNRAEGDDPILVGQSVAVGSGPQGAELEIVAGGSNIWNPGDFEHFVHTEKTGNFDVAVEVVRFDRSPNTGSFGHAGIQVRESLYTEAAEQYTADGTKVRNVMNTTYAEGNVERSAIAIWRDEVDANYGNSPVIGSDAQINGIQGRWGRLRAGDATGAALPNTSPTASRWLRLTRQGDEFISWYSYDGQTWQEHNRHTLALPAKVLVGFAEMADSPGVTGNNVNRAWHYNALHIRNFGDIGTVQAPTLTVSRSGTEVRINWGGVGTLETSSAASGAAWSPIVGAPNPYVTQATADAAYYRSRIP
jgi:regulation of enolase protein 1 (concanavalin A-like superfamily)